MDIVWFGKSAIRLKNKKGALVCNPCPKTKYEDMKRPVANAITLSSSDPAQSYSKGIKGNPLIVDVPGEFEIAGMQIQGSPFVYSKNELSIMFLIEMDAIRILHLGNQVNEDNFSKIEQFDNIDILLYPIISKNAENSVDVSKIIRSLEAKLIIPMNYNNKKNEDMKILETFNKSLGLQIENAGDKLSIKKNELSDKSKIVILNQK
ncbi:MAG: MBL fold metallo-hydrolase [Dehalococcoidia bacterium]|nr:MBL fold metallo-hydrolase [Dehalococcoidia bacterium]